MSRRTRSNRTNANSSPSLIMEDQAQVFQAPEGILNDIQVLALKENLESKIRLLSDKLLSLEISSEGYTEVASQLKSNKEKYHLLKERFKEIEDHNSMESFNHHGENFDQSYQTWESKLLQNLCSQCEFTAGKTDPAVHLKKLLLLFNSENVELSAHLFCRAVLRTLLSKNARNNIAASKFEKYVLQNPTVNQSMQAIQNTFVKLFPHRNILELEKEFWRLQFSSYSLQSNSMSEFIDKFEALSVNLGLDVDSNHSLSYFRALMPSWVATRLHQQLILKTNISSQQEADNVLMMDWKSCGTFQNFTFLISEIYSANFRSRNSKSSHSNPFDKEANSSPISETYSGKPLGKFCSYCKRSNHSIEECRIKKREESKTFDQNTNGNALDSRWKPHESSSLEARPSQKRKF